MEISEIRSRVDDSFEKNILYLAILMIGITGLVAANNVITDGDRRTEVGPTEVFTVCEGVEFSDLCLGVERPDHETIGYDTWNGTPEEGTKEYYTRVESELMIQAYNICEDDNLEGMDWLEQAEYDGKNATEWSEMEEIDLYGCENTFRFQVDE
jgi:hypothetical protein